MAAMAIHWFIRIAAVFTIVNCNVEPNQNYQNNNIVNATQKPDDVVHLLIKNTTSNITNPEKLDNRIYIKKPKIADEIPTYQHLHENDICFKVQKSLPTVPNIFNSKKFNRLVLYVYEFNNNGVNNKLVYIPGTNKQRAIPDIPYEASDHLVNSNDAYIISIFNNDPTSRAPAETERNNQHQAYEYNIHNKPDPTKISEITNIYQKPINQNDGPLNTDANFDDGWSEIIKNFNGDNLDMNGAIYDIRPNYNTPANTYADTRPISSSNYHYGLPLKKPMVQKETLAYPTETRIPQNNPDPSIFTDVNNSKYAFKSKPPSSEIKATMRPFDKYDDKTQSVPKHSNSIVLPNKNEKYVDPDSFLTTVKPNTVQTSEKRYSTKPLAFSPDMFIQSPPNFDTFQYHNGNDILSRIQETGRDFINAINPNQNELNSHTDSTNMQMLQQPMLVKLLLDAGITITTEGVVRDMQGRVFDVNDITLVPIIEKVTNTRMNTETYYLHSIGIASKNALRMLSIIPIREKKYLYAVRIPSPHGLYINDYNGGVFKLPNSNQHSYARNPFDLEGMLALSTNQNNLFNPSAAVGLKDLSVPRMQEFNPETTIIQKMDLAKPCKTCGRDDIHVMPRILGGNPATASGRPIRTKGR